MDKLREEFEQWFDKFYKSQPMYSEDEKEELSVYLWLAWRDSRRGIVVELPEMEDFELLDGYKVRESLRSIGLSIKGE